MTTDRRTEATSEADDDGVDVSLIRWMLSLTPEQRLDVLQRHVNAVLALRSRMDAWKETGPSGKRSG